MGSSTSCPLSPSLSPLLVFIWPQDCIVTLPGKLSRSFIRGVRVDYNAMVSCNKELELYVTVNEWFT